MINVNSVRTRGPPLDYRQGRRAGHKPANRDTLSREGSIQRTANMNWYPPIMRKPRGGFLDMEGNNEEKGGAVQRIEIYFSSTYDHWISMIYIYKFTALWYMVN